MTKAELIAALAEYPLDATVILAVEPYECADITVEYSATKNNVYLCA